MKLRKKDKGKFVFVSLWDHAAGDKTIYTETVGWIEKVTPKTLILRYWRTPNDKGFIEEDGDSAIVRSTIKEIRVLADPSE